MIGDSSEPAAPGAEPQAAARLVAFFEVLLCSDIPTQLAIGSTLNALGFRLLRTDGRLSIAYAATLLLIDTVVLLALIVMFLRAHGERPRDVFFGTRSWRRELAAGVPMAFVALAIGAAVMLTIQTLVPSLHNVVRNPIAALIERPRDAWLFGIVVIAAGGVREELQRAFILHRFERWLGGGTVGVLVSSAAFGAGHTVQGIDVAITTGVLGLFWGVVYLRRRSAVAPMVSHSAFDLLEIVVYLAARNS